VAGAEWGRVRALSTTPAPDQGGRPSVPGRGAGLQRHARGGRPRRGGRVRGARPRGHRLPHAPEARPPVGARRRERPLARRHDARPQGGRGPQGVPVVVRADVQGSARPSWGAGKARHRRGLGARLQAGVGGISESDITLAEASGAVVLGFNVRAHKEAREAAERAGVEIRYYNIIYDLVDDVKAAMSGCSRPTLREERLGEAQILRSSTCRRSARSRAAACSTASSSAAQCAADPRQRRGARGQAQPAQALQGRCARGDGRPGMRHGLRELPGHAPPATSSSATASTRSGGPCKRDPSSPPVSSPGLDPGTRSPRPALRVEVAESSPAITPR
jgi:hypothetical protein